jgi:hypothetical protein
LFIIKAVLEYVKRVVIVLNKQRQKVERLNQGVLLVVVIGFSLYPFNLNIYVVQLFKPIRLNTQKIFVQKKLIQIIQSVIVLVAGIKIKTIVDFLSLKFVDLIY